jgi:CubicO group peptidase (beta-lactamase class C family)
VVNRRIFLMSTAGVAAARPLPDAFGWPQGGTKQLGFDELKLEAARANLASRKTKALLILKSGRIALEWYAPGMSATTKHYTASMAKALVGGTSLLVAMADGKIRASDRASNFIPAWRDDPRKSKITIRHLATHTSGIEDSSVDGIEHNQEPGWKGRFWRREPDPFSISVREAPVLFEPGTGNQYSNPGMAALAYAVTSSLRGAAQSDILSLLRERVMRPLGVPDDEWNIGYGRAYKIDGLDLYANWGGAGFSPRATARLAEWMMHGGQVDDKQLLPRRVFKQAVSYAGMPIPDRKVEPHAPGSGLCWYSNFDAVWPSVPRDAFAGAGAGHQIVLAIPSLDMIVVRNGTDLAKEDEASWWTAVNQHLFEPVMDALGNPAKPQEPPYPKSAAIRGISFAAPSTVQRQGIDSDNWPVTWGDDDNLYTSYGDGYGFEPYLKEKLSMGFARIEGPPEQFRGINLRSSTGETTGDGPAGAKASGIVMIDGVLYMWVRNLKNSQLFWSRDHARTWEKGFVLDRGFGSPAFLNFGKNYSGAPDGFVYAYSQQGPSAYAVDDAIVLARAPKSQIRERNAWRVFTGADSQQAAWSADIAAAKPVFQFRKHCQRVDAVYHAATRRYLLVVSYGHNGGWGLFDAPQAWGPWSVVFHSEYWGLGETHGYRIPTKWISNGGHELTLIFSGLIYNGVSYDAFCTRKMRLDF